MADEDIPEKFRYRVVRVYAIVSERQAEAMENRRGVIQGTNGEACYRAESKANEVCASMNDATRAWLAAHRNRHGQ